MIRKRLVGMVTVKDGWAVQSFGYRSYLPLGRPEVAVENLDRWGADEIVVQCIDRQARGPDLDLLARISRLGLATPLIYGGGIRGVEDACAVVAAAADRIAVDALLHDDPAAVAPIAEQLGAQAVIAALPLGRQGKEVTWRDYRSGTSGPLSNAVMDLLSRGIVSEVLAIDWRHEGERGAFDHELPDALPSDVSLIAFGGLSETNDLATVFARDNVVAAAIGNFLAYEEHAIQRYRAALSTVALRPAHFGRSVTS